MKEIPLTHGQTALIDDEDAELVARYNWIAVHRKNLWYGQGSAKGEKVLMHRLVMGFPEGQVVDHRNGIGTDNRKENLRVTTQAQNGRNRRANANSSSGFVGVSWSKDRHRWLACIKVDGKTKNLGRFKTETEAAQAYNTAAKAAFGEFAGINEL